MGDKAWKAFERWVASQFDTNRIPVLGREGADIATGGLWIDAKKRQSVPVVVYGVMDAVNLLGHEAVVFDLDDKTYLMARTVDFAKAMKEKRLPIIVRAQSPLKIGAAPVRWLEHISESAPKGTLPAVVMSQSGKNYISSVILVHSEPYNNWLLTVMAEPYASQEVAKTGE